MDTSLCLIAQAQRPELWALALLCLMVIAMSVFHIKIAWCGFVLAAFGYMFREPKDSGNATAEASTDKTKGAKAKIQLKGPTSYLMISIGGAIVLADVVMNREPIWTDAMTATAAVVEPISPKTAAMLDAKAADRYLKSMTLEDREKLFESILQKPKNKIEPLDPLFPNPRPSEKLIGEPSEDVQFKEFKKYWSSLPEEDRKRRIFWAEFLNRQLKQPTEKAPIDKAAP